jgi:hypothetical protein
MPASDFLPQSETIARAKEAVVLGFMLGFDVGKHGLLLKAQLHTGDRKAFFISAMDLERVCEDLLANAELLAAGFNPPQRQVEIFDSDWSDPKGSIVDRTTPVLKPDAVLFGFRLRDGSSAVLTLAPGHALVFASEIRAAFDRGDLLDLKNAHPAGARH